MYNYSRLFKREFVYTVLNAGSGSALRKQVDPNPQQMNADPQPSLCGLLGDNAVIVSLHGHGLDHVGATAGCENPAQ